jgi:hypothetical protein
MSMRWRKKDESTLRKKVKNYNSKINRLKKKGYDETLLPEKLNFKELRENLNDRRLFNNQVKIMDAMTKRGSEQTVKSDRGLVLPKFTIEEVKIKLSDINRERRKRKKEYEGKGFTDRNKKIPNTEQVKNSMNTKELKNKYFKFKNKSKNDFEMFKRTLNEYGDTVGQRNKDYRRNYYYSIFSNYTKEQSADIINVLEQLDNNTLVDKYYTDRNMDIKYNYEKSNNDKRFKVLKDAWKSVVKENNATIPKKADRDSDTFNYYYDMWIEYQKADTK